MQALKRQPHLRNAFFVFIPESNYGFEAQNFSLALEESGAVTPGNYTVMKEDENERGVRTDDLLKLAMATSIRRYLENAAAGSIRFHKKFFTLGKSGEGRPEERRALRKVIVDQLRMYTRFVIPPKTPFDEPTVKFSGKHSGKLDDLSIAVQLAIFMTTRFYTNDKYKDAREGTHRGF